MAADGEVENGFAELLDVFVARGEAREVVEVEVGVSAKGITVRAIVKTIKRRSCQTIPPALPFRLRGL